MPSSRRIALDFAGLRSSFSSSEDWYRPGALRARDNGGSRQYSYAKSGGRQLRPMAQRFALGTKAVVHVTRGHSGNVPLDSMLTWSRFGTEHAGRVRLGEHVARRHYARVHGARRAPLAAAWRERERQALGALHRIGQALQVKSKTSPAGHRALASRDDGARCAGRRESSGHACSDVHVCGPTTPSTVSLCPAW